MKIKNQFYIQCALIYLHRVELCGGGLRALEAVELGTDGIDAV